MQCRPVPKLRDESERVYREAVELFQHKAPSISNIERYLRPGYALAARVMARMEAEKLVSSPQRDGVRVWFGPGADGRRKFREFAEGLRAANEPAAHWWNALPAHRKTRVLAGAAMPWSDVSERDRTAVRAAYFRALERLRGLQAEFRHLGGWQFVGGVAA